MKQHIIKLTYIILLFFVLGSCKKDEQVIDKTPITVGTLEAGDLRNNHAILYGEIHYLNDEQILDYGFKIALREETTFRTISLGKQAKVGIISYDLQSTFKIGEFYQYIFYVKTDKNTYEGRPVYFTVNDIWVDNSKIQYASPGDIITIKGQFKQVDDLFKLSIGDAYNGQNNEIPFTLDKDKESLTFTMPSKNLYHGAEARIVLSKKINYQEVRQYLLSFKIAARLLPPSPGTHYYTDPIKLKAIGLSDYLYHDFKIILGDKVLRYEDNYYAPYLPLNGHSYKLGYIWGQDTIYLKETWNLEVPDMKTAALKYKIVHPFGHTELEGLDFFKYLVNSKYKLAIGKYEGDLAMINFEKDIPVHIGDIPEGKYPIAINSNVYGDLKINDQLIVQNLRITAVDAGTGYYEDPIRIKGNFLPNQEYVIKSGDFEVYFGFPKNGELVFPCPFTLLKGDNNVKIGYAKYGGNFFEVDSKVIKVNGLSIDSFYPTKGAPGDIVKLKVRGAKTNYYRIGIGGIEVSPISAKLGEMEFMVPTVNKKGKTKIKLLIDNQVFESNEYFEII